MRDSHTTGEDLTGSTLDLVCRHRFAQPLPERVSAKSVVTPQPAKMADVEPLSPAKPVEAAQPTKMGDVEPASKSAPHTNNLQVASNQNGTLTLLETQPVTGVDDAQLEFRGTFANFASEPDQRGLLDPKNLEDVKTNRARSAERVAWETFESRALDALTQAERIFKSHWRKKDSQDLIPERRDSVTLESQGELGLVTPKGQPPEGRSLLSYLRSLVGPQSAATDSEPQPIVSGDAGFSHDGRLVSMEATLGSDASGEQLAIKLEPGLLRSKSGQTSEGFRMRLESSRNLVDPIELFLDSEHNQIGAVEFPKIYGNDQPATLLEGFSLPFRFRTERPTRWNAFEVTATGGKG
ncbi:MAG: hypothetical protein KC800_17230 [Candidatus Eremiobacteraeota bacterium]|nr:hypothetical protein [Candidatus Eremiobacteraeota bacterium]